MAKTSELRVRLEPHVKAQAEEVLGELGVSASEAVRQLYHQIILCRGIPYELRVPQQAHIPNKKTARVLNQSRKKLKTYTDKEVFLKSLGLDDASL